MRKTSTTNCASLCFAILTAVSAETSAQPLWKDFVMEGVVPMMTGWGSATVLFDKEYFTLAEPVAVKGDVGSQLQVEAPTILCPAGSSRAKASPKILSGSLPPGVWFKTGEGLTIAGTPRERGKWTVRMQLYPVYCDDEPMPGFTQEMEFLIGAK